eukprot:2274881-Alexandrium_andersonii.AAC.1
MEPRKRGSRAPWQLGRASSAAAATAADPGASQEPSSWSGSALAAFAPLTRLFAAAQAHANSHNKGRRTEGRTMPLSVASK